MLNCHLNNLSQNLLLKYSFRTLLSLFRLFSQNTSLNSVLVLEVKKENADVRLDSDGRVSPVSHVAEICPCLNRQQQTLCELLCNFMKVRWKSLLSQEINNFKKYKPICVHWSVWSPNSVPPAPSVCPSTHPCIYPSGSVTIIESKEQIVCSRISRR